VLGAQVDDNAVLTVQCNAQQLFLAMTGSRKVVIQASLAVYFYFIFSFTSSQHSEGDEGE
jgi:hypothetical protein